jgi:hypothetical protein
MRGDPAVTILRDVPISLTPEEVLQAQCRNQRVPAHPALVSKVLSDEASLPDWEREPAAVLLNRALGNAPPPGRQAPTRSRCTRFAWIGMRQSRQGEGNGSTWKQN